MAVHREQAGRNKRIGLHDRLALVSSPIARPNLERPCRIRLNERMCSANPPSSLEAARDLLLNTAP